MSEVLMIQIGEAGKGGWWYAIDARELFGDGFRSEAAAIEAAAAAAGSTPYEIWYECEHKGRRVAIPGAKSANHPEERE